MDIFGSRKQLRTADLEQRVADLEQQLEAERKINETLRQGIILACNPANTSADRVQEVMDQAATDFDANIVQAPDGEYIAPEAYNWERLAHDMYDNDQGGASASW